MTALIFHDRAAHIASGIPVSIPEILQSEVQIGGGVEQRRRRSAETERARCGKPDLHQAVIPGVHNLPVVIAFDTYDCVGKSNRHGIVARLPCDYFLELTGPGFRIGSFRTYRW